MTNMPRINQKLELTPLRSAAQLSVSAKMKPLNLATLIGLSAFLLLGLFESFLGLLSIFAWMAIAIYTLILAIVLLFRAVKNRQPAVLYPVILIAVVVTLWFVTPIKLVSPYLRLFVEESEYREAIEAVARGNNSLCKRLGCIIESKEEKQVAFVWDGIIDNWHGICHDPNATVLNANILKGDWSNRSDPEYGKAAGMFGGAMTGAVHLWGDWYLCSFT